MLTALIALLFASQQFFDEEVPCQEYFNECVPPPETQQFINDEPKGCEEIIEIEFPDPEETEIT